MTKKGFTLLELIVVIMIVGVLAFIALPRFARMIQRSHSVEALVNISALRQSLERCYIMAGNLEGCNFATGLDIEDPTNSPNSHFNYTPWGAATQYGVWALRNTKDGGDGTSGVDLLCDVDSGGICQVSGTGIFSGIK